MQQLTPFLVFGMAGPAFLKNANIFYVKDFSNGCLFAQKTESSSKIYYLRSSLYLLNKEEVENKYKIETINASTLGRLTEGIVNSLCFSQEVFYSPGTTDEYHDKERVKNSIDHYAFDYSTSLGTSRGTSRYLLQLVRTAFTGKSLMGQVYTLQGISVSNESFTVTRKAFLNNLNSLADKNIILYEEVEPGVAIVKFSKKALKYDAQIAPKFFDALTF